MKKINALLIAMAIFLTACSDEKTVEVVESSDIPTFESQALIDLAEKNKAFINELTTAVENKDMVAFQKIQQQAQTLAAEAQTVTASLSDADKAAWTKYQEEALQKMQEAMTKMVPAQ